MDSQRDSVIRRVNLTPALLRYVQKNQIFSIAVVPGRNNCCAFRCAKAQVKMNIALRCEGGAIQEVSTKGTPGQDAAKEAHGSPAQSTEDLAKSKASLVQSTTNSRKTEAQSIEDLPKTETSLAQSTEDLAKTETSPEQTTTALPLCFFVENRTVFLHPALKAAQEELTLGLDRFLWACAFWAEGLTLNRRCPKTKG